MVKIYRSHIPDQHVAEESVFTNLFVTRFDQYPPSHPAFIDAATGFTITRGELKKLALSTAWGFRHEFGRIGGLPISRGDTVMIFSPNSIAWPIMLHGIFAAGLRATPANIAYTPREVEHQWLDSGAKIALVEPTLIPVVLETFKSLGFTPAEARQRIIAIDWHVSHDKKAVAGFIKLTDLVGKGSLKEEEKFTGKQVDETLLLCYSSGTTGKPKGVESTHRNVVGQLAIAGTIYPATAYDKDVLLGFVPCYHIYGSVMLMQFPFSRGVPVVLMPKFDPVEFCRSIERYKVTQSLIVPPVCLAIIHHPATNKFNLSSLRFLYSGAAPLSGALVKGTVSKLKSVGATAPLSQGYGLTETTPTSHILDLEHYLTKVGSVGQMLPNLEARLVREDGTDADEGQPGELWLRGPSVMKGYLNNPTANANAFTKDRWFKTGDVATRDTEGYFYIVDRQKELIKFKGFQVPPAELESVLLSHPDILDAAVIGVHSDLDATELPRAYVVHAKGLKGEAAKRFSKEIQLWMQKRVANHKFLRGGVVVIDTIPKSAAGKVLRRELRDRAKEELLKEPLVSIRGTKAKL